MSQLTAWWELVQVRGYVCEISELVEEVSFSLSLITLTAYVSL